jgi:hypothetical protein
LAYSLVKLLRTSNHASDWMLIPEPARIDAGNKIFQADGYEKYGPVLAQQLTPAMAVRCKGRAEKCRV